MTGLTLKDGKYVYVRGLGERYSGVQLNQFALPSPEPARRVVPLDLFPVSVLESVVVQKSYSPNLPGEFGGGVIQLKSKSLPEKFFAKGTISTGYEDFNNRLSYLGGSTDWLGIDDGSRKMPTAIKQVLKSGRKLVIKQPGSDEGLSQEELTQLGQSLPNKYATSRTSDVPPPGFSIALGNKYRIGGKKVGAQGSLLYGQTADQGERKSTGLNAMGNDRYSVDYTRGAEFSEIETRLAGQLELGLELSKSQALSFNSMLLRHTTNFTQFDEKQDPNSISRIESTTLDWTERELWTNQLKGQHKLGTSYSQPIEGQWRVGSANASRTSPDRREYAYERTPSSYQMRGDSGGNRRTYSELFDDSQEIGLDFTVPLSPVKDRLKLTVGANHLERQRHSEVFRLFFSGPVTGAPIEEQLDPGNIGPGGFELHNITDAADSYKGEQKIQAFYGNLEYAPLSQWSFQAGMRQEESVQRVSTFRYFEPDKPFSESELKMSDLLPAYSVVWKPNENWRSRTAYSETLARPDFRELSEVGFIDDETGYEVHGNSQLKGTVIQNIDHRWEYYWSADEYVSLGGFYKQFKNPIEVMFVPGVNRIQTFANAKGAQNYGVELESRLGLRQATRALRRWSILANLTLIQSEIELDETAKGIQTSDRRPLQGQAPYVVNFQLQYDRPLWNLSATLLYSIVGERITEVGTNEIPDTLERPYHQVDFVASKSISKSWSVALRAKNLLDPRIESYQGSELVKQSRNGRVMGVSLSGTY